MKERIFSLQMCTVESGEGLRPINSQPGGEYHGQVCSSTARFVFVGTAPVRRTGSLIKVYEVAGCPAHIVRAKRVAFVDDAPVSARVFLVVRIVHSDHVARVES